MQFLLKKAYMNKQVTKCMLIILLLPIRHLVDLLKCYYSWSFSLICCLYVLAFSWIFIFLICHCCLFTQANILPDVCLKRQSLAGLFIAVPVAGTLVIKILRLTETCTVAKHTAAAFVCLCWAWKWKRSDQNKYLMEQEKQEKERGETQAPLNLTHCYNLGVKSEAC